MKKSFFIFIRFALALILISNHCFAQSTRQLKKTVILNGHKLQLSLPAPPATIQSVTHPALGRMAGCANDTVLLTRQSQIDSFPITNPECTVLYNLIIDGSNASPAITRLDSLKYITEVTNEFQVTHTSVTDLNGMAGLQKVDWMLWLDHNPLMNNIKPPNATYLNGFDLDSLPLISSLSNLLTGLTNTHLDYFWLFDNIPITNFSGLEGMDSINHIGAFFLPNLQNFSGLQNIHYAGEVIIYNNLQLTDISALSNVTQLPLGKLDVSYEDALTSWNGLQNIIHIGGGLTIEGNQNITSLSATGLNPGLVIDGTQGANNTVLIDDNPNLSVCNWPPLCNYLAAGKPADVSNNAPGCNDTTEVEASCGNLNCSSHNLKTWNGNSSTDWNDDNNWTPVGVPDQCDSILIPSDLSNYPVLSANVICSGLIMQDGTSLEQNEFNFIVSGNVTITNSTVTDSYAPEGTFSITNAHNKIDIRGVDFDDPLFIQEYTCPLTFQDNTCSNNVSISDLKSRVGNNDFGGNEFDADFSILSNSTDLHSTTYLGDGDDSYNGNLYIFENMPHLFSTGNIHVGGNLTVNSNQKSDNLFSFSNVDFNGNKDAHITQLGTATIQIGDLSTNKSPGKIILDQNVYVNGSTSFNQGLIKTAPGKLLIFGNPASIAQTSSASWIWGPAETIGHNQFLFPIGDSVHQAVISYQQPSILSTDTIYAQYFPVNPSLNGYDTSQHDPGLIYVSGKEYWKLIKNNTVALRTDGAEPPQPSTITLSYDNTRSNTVQSVNSLQSAQWNTNQWKNLGVTQVTGDLNQAYVTSLDTLLDSAIVTLGYTGRPRIPVITIGKADTVSCWGSIIHIPFSLDTLADLGNNFNAEISDSSGSFATPTILGLPLVSNHSDTLAVVGANLPEGNHYRLRVVGTSPADTSVNQPLILVEETPSNSITITGSKNACIGGGVYKYYATTSPLRYVTYNWSLDGGGTYTTNNDTIYITWTTVGTHYISVYNSNHCGDGTIAYLQVSVSPPPPSALPTLNNIGRWLYSSIPDASQNSLGYHWYRNDTLIDSANNSSYYAPDSGSYTVKYYNLCGESPASNIISYAADAIPQTISFDAIPDKTFGDSAFILNATASSSLPVTFTLISGPASINPVTNLLTILHSGTVTIAASQQGNNIYDTAATVTRTFVINKAPQSITFPGISDKDIYNTSSFTLSATVSSGLPLSISVVSGPAFISGNTATLTGIGTVTIKASQTGDTDYLAAPDVVQSFCVSISKLNPITGPNSICPATDATYTVNNIQGATYTWYVAGSGNLSSTTNSLSTQWPTTGNYTLIVNAAGGCGAPSYNDSLSIVVQTFAKPDSVHGMLPADGAINQQLPLTLSWIPANPNLNYTFDIYLWRSDSTQPLTPIASNITTVNYTIPVTANLSYRQTYKWMVVAHNGSCTQINTGPIQQFTLIPLADLQVMNVQVPSTAFSGQTISINWTVKNNGPGSTGDKTWTDAVFFSFDSIPNFHIPPETNPGAWNLLEFPIRPLLLGTKSNVSSLDSGQEYSNSINVTLPLNYSQPLYVYVISNYPNSGNAPLQTTYSNDTARAPQPIIVTLSPQPDLRVDSVFTPASTFTGSTMSLTYKVKNYGALTPTGSAWNDSYYISNSPFFDVNTATLLKFPKPNGSYYYNAPDAQLYKAPQLQPDSSYTASVPVVIPNFLTPGTYYIYVVTNSTNSLYEGPNTNNNVNYNLVQVFLTPTPVLTISSLSTPASASTTQVVGINWNIKNTGFYDNIEKNKGHYGIKGIKCLAYTNMDCDNNGENCYVENVIGHFVKDSLGWGSSYWNDKVYLSRDSSLDINNAIYMGLFLHGGDRNFYNNAGVFNDDMGYPFNSCLAGGLNDYYLAEVNTQNVIYPGKDFPSSLNFTIPDTLSQGNYYVYVFGNPDHEVFEYPGTPQIRRSDVPITIQRPDVVVSTINAPSSATAGQPVSINYIVTNNGPGTVFNHFRNDKLFVSSSPVFDNTAIAVGNYPYYEGIPFEAGVPHTISYTFPPSTSGTMYLYVQTNYDSSFRETNQNNNISAAAAISITQASAADLSVTGITLSDTVFTASPQFFKYTVTNNGLANSNTNWTDSIFISCVPAFNPSTAYFVTKRNHSGIIASGNNYTDSFNFSLPYSFLINSCFPNAMDAPAYFFVKTNADGGMYEGVNTGNNITGSGMKDLRNPFPDHIVTSVTGADSVIVGRPYSITWTVKNQGYNPGPGYYYNWNDGIYLSPDSVYNSNAILIGGYTITSALNTNQTYTVTKSPTIPLLPAGNYYLMVYTNKDNTFIESNTTNNSRVMSGNVGSSGGSGDSAIIIHVTQPLLPDLTDSVLSANSSVALGQPLSVVHQVTNIGAGVTYPNTWIDNVWLSSDFTPNNGNDILLYSKNHNGNLLPGQQYADNITTNPIPYNITPGNYILIVQTNANGAVTETNTKNNLAYYYVTVYNPPPVDLQVPTIVNPDTVYLGDNIDTLKWVVWNNSANLANGVSTDGIYLTHNSTLDSTATLIGIVNKYIKIAPLSRDTLISTPLVTGVTEGSYNVIVKTDIQNNILETNKNNNSNVSSTPIYVKVRPLPLNILTADSMHYTARYYKLAVPDSLLGATILVTLTSNDSLSVNNQIYIGGGYLPSAAQFDYEYSKPNYGNQQIIMTSVTDSVYYITVVCTTNNPPKQYLTLKASVLPFAILSVDANSGGNSGNVTVKITGSLFTNNMTAKLVHNSTTIVASAVYYSNSTEVYATFNLAGQPLGAYDVKLQKPDSTTAVLPNGFTIVAPNNGGLITGGGVNTGAGDGNGPGCDPGAAAGLNSQLSIELVTPETAFGGWAFPIQINYKNPTNVDIPAQIRVLYSLDSLPVALSQANLNGAGPTLYLEFTEQNGPPGIIRAGGSGTITVYSRAPKTFPAHTKAHFTIK